MTTSAPADLQRLYRDIRTYEGTRFVSELVGPARRILIIGDEWGRDYYTLANRGLSVFNMDIAWQPHIPRLTVANDARGIPFSAGSFDAVVMAEVLEHLAGDEAALGEARRVLHDDGRLVVSVPFFNDEPEYHIRIHSMRTITRLLGHCGFTAVERIYRGGLISVPRAVGLVARALGRARVLDWCAGVDRSLGRNDHWLFRRTALYGGYVMARKGPSADYAALNAAEFSQAATRQRMGTNQT